jgi:hypothetical protein
MLRAIRRNNTVAVAPGRRLTVKSRHEIRGEEVRGAIKVVDDAQVADVIDSRLHGHEGSKTRLRARGLLVCLVLAAEDSNSQERTDVACTIASLPPSARLELGLFNDDGSPLSYRAVEKQVKRLETALGEGWLDENDTEINHEWLRSRLFSASVPAWRRDSISAVAVDGTPFETWAFTTEYGKPGEFPDPYAEYLRKSSEGLEVDEPDLSAIDLESTSEPTVGSLGRDRRPIRSKDVEARTSWATGVNNTSGHHYTGYEAHLVVATRSVHWSGNPSQIALGAHQPGYLLGADVVPAGSLRGPAGLAAISMASTVAPGIDEVLGDLGYTALTKPTEFLRPLHEKGIHVVMDYSKDQRAKVDVIHVDGESLVVNCGHVLHASVPKNLHRIVGNRRLRGEQWDSAMDRYEERSRTYRWSLHQSHENGDRRFECPFEHGLASNPDLYPPSISSSNRVTPVAAPKGMERCCQGRMIRVPAKHLDHFQKVPHGTRAWEKSYGRRNAVEGVNGELRIEFHFGRGYVKAFGLSASNLAVTMVGVAYNIRLAEKDSDPEALPATDSAAPKNRETETTDESGSIGDPTSDLDLIGRGHSPPT